MILLVALLVLVQCATVPQVKKEKFPTGHWAGNNLPGGGGDYSLGANYGPLFKGKVGGEAQDIDNDNNNNDDNNNDNNNNNNAPASVMGDMNDIEIFDEITNVNLNFDSNPDLNSNGNVFESTNTKVEQLPTPQLWTPDQITALVTSVLKNMPAGSDLNVKVNGQKVEKVETTEDFVKRAQALQALRAAGPIHPVTPVNSNGEHKKRSVPQKKHVRHTRHHNLRRFRSLRRQRRDAAPVVVSQAMPVTSAQNNGQNSAPQKNNAQVGAPPNMGGGGGGVYNVESNFAPKFLDNVGGSRQADDNDNNNNADNNNDNNNNDNNAVQVSGSGNKMRYHVKDRNININLNMNYFGNANHNAGQAKPVAQNKKN